MFTVYKHTCPNGKVYIGITGNDVLKRWSNGISSYSNNNYFLNAIKKYGWNNIKHEILFDGLTEKEACQKEIDLIAQYKSNNPNYGYNLSSGGECHTKGCKWTTEHKQKTSNSLTGHFVSEKTKEKIKNARANQQNITNPPVHIGKDNNKAKSVVVISKNGDVLLTFETVSEAAKHFNVCHQSVSDCCRGKLKTVKKMIFRYECEVN